ncbi:hypothetical protein TSUD_286540 [Trifolium subterraneum]|uniref:FBD domain-containing protein n=1 Tax=Trifolium subterraneum TaxID=3900 RepID=A0A2Z6P796_TRISU|nr:hypothetical protein TSUD_286540 [Trifolium subterraneum]
MNSRSRKTQKKKNGTEMENVVEEDMFYSKLSEPHLISHILSFLPTRDAVRTSVLSKKWLDNWTFITKLDFDDGLYRDNGTYRICTHCKSRKQGDFYVSNKVGSDDLNLCEDFSKSEDALYNGGNSLSFSDLTKVKRGDTKLRLHFEQFVYNALLFTKNNNSSISSMLERFSLVINNNHDVGHLNIWISCILKRRVKNLKIHSSDHNRPFSASTSKSLLNSTQLEELELVLKKFTTINVPTNSVHFEHLKHLKLSGINFTIDPSCDYLTLRLPVLKKFEISNCKCFMPYASVKIILKQYENNISETRCFAFQILQHLQHAKYLKFEGLEFLTQSKEDVYTVSSLPVFANLSHMELGIVTIEDILGLLQNSPVLKTVVLALNETPKFAKELLNFAVVPDCLTSALQIVNFEKVKGDEQVLFLAEFLLKNGKMLERMSFSLSNQKLAKAKAMKEFKEKLYSFKKGHSFGYLEFSYDSGPRSSSDDSSSSDDDSSESSDDSA